MDKQLSTKHYTENERPSNTDRLKPGMNLAAPEGYAVPAPLVVTPVTNS